MVELKECELKVRGMDCPSCAMNVENSVKKLDGVSDISVNFIMGKALIKYDPSHVNTSEIITAIEKAGYTAIEDEKEINHEESCSSCATDIFEEKPPIWKQRSTLIIALSSVLLALGLYIEFVLGMQPQANIFYL
ncbi:MAG: cation transporter, partial [Candidatus Methanoperedens sp.]|nr:cation transporter [Candidatus Methanoperedens sp.]